MKKTNILALIILAIGTLYLGINMETIREPIYFTFGVGIYYLATKLFANRDL